MSQKTAIWVGMCIGSILGGILPGLWGAGVFSLSGVFLSAIGGVFGIYLGFQLSR